ncbi:hypothetical protein BsWGS_06307 [Bradybaena similaris]
MRNFTLLSVPNRTETSMNIQEIFYTVVQNNNEQFSVLPRVVEILLSTIGIIFNGFFIIVIMNTPSLAEVKTTKFIMSLSISDLFVSGIVMVFSVLVRMIPEVTEEDGTNRTACWMWASVSMAACTASSLNVCAISVDRYLSISFPLHYENFFTRFRINAVIVSVWAISCSMAFVTLYLGFGDSSEHVPQLENHDLSNETADQPLNNTYVTFINYCQELPDKLYIVAIVTLIVLLPCLAVTLVYLEIFRLVTKQIRVIRKEQACARRLTKIPHIRSRLSVLALHSSIMEEYKISEQRVDQTTDPATPGNSAQSSRFSKMYIQKGDFLTARQTESTTESEQYVIQQNLPTSSSTSSLKSTLVNVYSDDEKQCRYVITEHHRIYYIGEHDKDGAVTPDILNTSRRGTLKSIVSTPKESKRGRQSLTGQYILSLIKCPSIHPPLEEIRRSSTLSAAIGNLSHRMSFPRNAELKAVAVLMLIAGTYVVCWLPFGIVSILLAYNPGLVSWRLREVFLWLAYSNSCWNPLIYALLNKTFRSSIYVFLAKHGCNRCLTWSQCGTKRMSVSGSSI